MDTAFDIPDPTDWFKTPIPKVSDVEAPLHCQVCKDFFNTPMITSCSHTFCSLCIRKCLTEDGRCPACRSEDQQIKLRRNWIVEEIVEAFQQARQSLLELARTHDDTPRKRRRIERGSSGDGGATLDHSDQSLQGQEPPRRSSRRSNQRVPQTSTYSDVEEIESVEDDGLTACPICGQRMQEAAVFAHLDVHNNSRPLPSGLPRANPYFPTSNTQAKPTLEPLPQINYSLLKDQPLRKKLLDLGIRSDGPRQLLISRHKEWVNLVNANCDSQKPKSKTALLKELEIWDSTQGRQILSTGAPKSTSSIASKDFDGKAWAANHNADFQKLIANARRKGKAGSGEANFTQDGSTALKPSDPVTVTVATSVTMDDVDQNPGLQDIAPERSKDVDTVDLSNY